MFTYARIVNIAIRLSAAIVMPVLAFVILLSVVSVSAPATAATEAEGDLDPAFGNGGVVTTSIAGQIQKMVVMLDGNVLVYGTEFVSPMTGTAYIVHKVARFTPDGTLDTDLGVSGVITLPFVPGSLFPDRTYTSVTLLPDGRFLAAARVGPTPAIGVLTRYTAAGAIDSSFGVNGVVTLTTDMLGTPDSLIVNDVAIRPSGELLMTGYFEVAGRLFVAQLSITQTFDTRFGFNGVVAADDFDAFEFGRQVFLQSDGSVSVIGQRQGAARMTGLPTFYRFSSTGISLPAWIGLFTSCDLNGTRAVPAPDGKFLATAQGTSPGLTCDQTLVGRLNADFSLDPTFTVISGSVISGTVPIVNLVQADGRIIGAADSSVPGGTALSAFRYTPTGANDPTFGSGGVAAAVITSTYPGISGTETITSSYGNAAATQLNGRITIGGSYARDNTYQSYFAIARFVGPAVVIRELRLPFIAKQPQP